MEAVGTATAELMAGKLDTSTTAKPKVSPEKIKDAAAQFEALLISQMMKSMRESSSGGWMGESGDSSSASMLELADEQFAKALAARGGLGIARLVVKGLEPRTAPTAPVVTDSSSE